MPLKLKGQNFCRSANAIAYPGGPGSVLGQCNYPQSWRIITLQPFDLQRCIVPLWKALLPFLLQNMTAFLGCFFCQMTPTFKKFILQGYTYFLSQFIVTIALFSVQQLIQLMKTHLIRCPILPYKPSSATLRNRAWGSATLRNRAWGQFIIGYFCSHLDQK